MIQEEEKEPIEIRKTWHYSVSDKIDKKALDKIDKSTNKDQGIDLKAEMEKYLGGDDEVLAGFLESDDETLPSFDSINPLKQEQKSIFGRLTSAFSSVVGNKQLTREDMDPILRQFAQSLMDKNVS